MTGGTRRSMVLSGVAAVLVACARPLKRCDPALQRLNVGMIGRIGRAFEQQFGLQRRQCLVAVESDVSPAPTGIFFSAMIWASIEASRPSSRVTSWPRNRVVCAANSVRERTSSLNSMVTSSFATLVATAGCSYSKPTVKAIASFFFDFEFLLGRPDDRALA